MIQKTIEVMSYQEILDYLPDIDCELKCADACGTLSISDFEENQLMTKITKKKYGIEYVRLGTVEENRLKIIEHKTSHQPSCQCLAKCPYLTNNNLCGIHLDRPVICRLYGIVEDFKCKYGCTPDRYLKKDEAHRILRRLNQLK